MLTFVATGIWKAASLWQVPATTCQHSEIKLLIYIDNTYVLMFGICTDHKKNSDGECNMEIFIYR
jgi:hypothetical protein